MSDSEGEVKAPMRDEAIKPANAPAKPSKRVGDSDSEGEDIARPSRTKPGMYSDEEEEDEEADNQVTEEDRRFIVADEEVEESDREGSGSEAGRRRKRSRGSGSDDDDVDEDLDEDDLDLIQANTGQKRRIKRHRISSRSPSPDAEDKPSRDNLQEAIFEDREDREESDRDEMDDFIVDDEERSGDEQERAERRRKIRRQESQKMKDIAAMTGVDEETYRMLIEIFGDDSYYESIQRLKKKSLATSGGRPTGDEDYMEEDEELRPAVQNLKLTDIYEPSVLVEKMLTDKDELIRAEDIPERLQLLRQDQTQPFGFVEAESDLDDEAAEIARQLREQRLIFGGAGSDADTKLVQVIRTLLYFMRGEKNHFLEVPFIAAHRKDYWQPYLGSDSIILWKIYELDLAYQARVGRTKELEALVRRVKGAAPDRATIDPNLDQISDYVETVEGVQDLRKYIFLHYGADLKRLDADEGKQLSKAARTAYELAREHGIGEVAKHYNLDVNSFVQSCVSDRKYFFPDDDAMEPFQAVSGHVNARYREEKHLVAATNKYLAEEIASHPQFRRLVRQKFELSALISVKPTAKGKDVITEEHEYFGFKYLTNKPVAAFKYGNFGVASDGVTAAPALKGQYALIARAVAEGLVTVDVDIADRADWVSKLERFIESDNTSEEAQMWNRHRRDILSMALSSVSQDATKWIKSKLLSEATDSICIDCRNVLGSRLMAAPFQRKKKEKGSRRNRNDSDSDSDSDDDDDDDKYRRDCRVAAVSWGEGGRNDPTYAVTLDEDGLVASYIQLNRMQDRGRDPACVQQSEDPAVRPPELAKPPKIADLERLGDFLVNSRPDVVVMAASTVAAMRLFQDVKDAVDKVRKSHTFLEHLEIHWILDDTATVWKNSAQAKAEFREYPEILRFCIGLARKAQDPVMAYASLFNTDQDIAKVSFIDKQSATPKDVLVKHMERAIVNAVAYVGVDINAAVKHRHKSYTLQFVSGLGPRKAGFVMGKVAALIEEKEVPGLEKRADLVSEKILGANVFFNCASFIRIRKYHFGRRSAYVDVLDDTRIHPEDYELARQMASDALDMDDLAEDEENPSQYVEELMSSKDMAAKLNDLDLDGYADELEKRLGSAKRLTLNDIKKELQNPYEDERTLRQLYPTIPELFYMLTKEPVQRFYPQHGLLATIRKKISRRVFVELPGGVEGEIEANEDDEVQRQAEGALIKVEIKDILVDAWKRTDMDVSVMTDAPKFLVAYDIANRAIMSGERDAAFDKDREREDERRRQEEQRKRMASQAMENVSHPLYRRDLDAESSERELASRAVGDIILRPSSKIGDLVAVVKMDENTYWHIHILKSIVNNAVKWQIRDFRVAFEDLDHLVAVYIDPIREKIREMNRHPKYRPGKSPNDTQDAVRQSSLTNPNQAAYALCSGGRDAPNTYRLIYKFPRTEHPSSERITIIPGHFLFRTQKWSTVDELILHFKKNPIRPAPAQQGYQTGYQTARPRPPGSMYVQPQVPASQWGGPGGPATMVPAPTPGYRPSAVGSASYYAGGPR